MGYAVGLIGLAAPMAALVAYLRYTGRAARRRPALSARPRPQPQGPEA